MNGKRLATIIILFTCLTTTVPALCEIEKPPNLTPHVSLSNTYTGQPGEVIYFNSSSWDDDGYIVKYVWDFGDGISKQLGKTATYVYQSDGVYNITLTVTDDEDSSNSANTTCTIISEIYDQGSNDYSGLFRNLGLLSIIGIFLYMFRTQFSTHI